MMRGLWLATLLIGLALPAGAEVPPPARWLAVPAGGMLIGQGWDSVHARPAPNRCLDGLPLALSLPPLVETSETPIFTVDQLGAALGWKPEQRLAAWAANSPPDWLAVPLAGTPDATLRIRRRLDSAAVWLAPPQGPQILPPTPDSLIQARPGLSGDSAARRAALATPWPGLRLSPFWAETLARDRPGFLAACGDAVVIALQTGQRGAQLRIGKTLHRFDRPEASDLEMAILPYARIGVDLPILRPARAAPLLIALARQRALETALARVRHPDAPYLTGRAAPAAMWQRWQATARGDGRTLLRAVPACLKTLARPSEDDCAVPALRLNEPRLRASLPPPRDPADPFEGRFLPPAELTARGLAYWLDPLDAALCADCARPAHSPSPLQPWSPVPALSFAADGNRCLGGARRGEAGLQDGCPDETALRYDAAAGTLTSLDGALQLMLAPDRLDPVAARQVVRLEAPGTAAYNGLPLQPLRIAPEVAAPGELRLKLRGSSACLHPDPAHPDSGRPARAITGPCATAPHWRALMREAAGK